MQNTKFLNIGTSIAFRSETAAPTASKEDVINKIKSARAKYQQKNSYEGRSMKISG